MIEDSLFDGPVKYYDSVGANLSKLYAYRRGKIEGKCIDYFPNGTISAEYSIVAGNYNGIVRSYDTAGKLIVQDEYYYGLKVGPICQFAGDSLIVYSFITFDGNKLFTIRYDSIMLKPITDYMSQFAIFTVTNYDQLDGIGSLTRGHDCFIYLPKPPRFRFSYSLVRVNHKLQIVDTIRKIESNLPWLSFQLPSKDIDSNGQLAIHVEVIDSTKVVGIMHALKRIKWEE